LNGDIDQAISQSPENLVGDLAKIPVDVGSNALLAALAGAVSRLDIPPGALFLLNRIITINIG
jgi:hypothetical protein